MGALSEAGAQIARTRLPGWLSEFVLACVGLREYLLAVAGQSLPDRWDSYIRGHAGIGNDLRRCNGALELARHQMP